MAYPFEGVEEERRAISWMIGELRLVHDKLVEGQAELIDELSTELLTRLNSITKGGARPASDWYDDLWDRFLFGVSGVWRDEGDETYEPPHEWGEWELAAPKEIKLGYSKSLKSTVLPRGGGSSVHYYTREPPPVHWDLSQIGQKNVRFYIGKATVAEIDAVCSVPQLPAEIDSEEAGLRVLDSRRGDQEWQRRLEGKRVLSIRNFIADSGNIIANSAIIFAPQSLAFSQDGNGLVTIDFSKFLRKEHGTWTDHAGKKDLRPLWLIDGQHRIRGLSQAEEGVNLEVPIILFPPQFTLAASAKIFSEINTLQKKLSPLHTLFMQHRFGIPSPTAKRDFRRPFSSQRLATWDSRANHLSYESSPHSPLRGRIRILDQNAPRYTIIQATQWVDFSRGWFADGEIYGPTCTESAESINKEVENFFRAFIATCNHDGWSDGIPRWSDSSKNKALVQRHGPSQALLKLFPTAWRLARRGYQQSPIGEERFREILRPLTWVDWLDDRLVPVFGGSGERPRTALRIWMETAILAGKAHPVDKVMATDIHSVAGQGMLSSPADGIIEASPARSWPTVDRPVILRARQPVNTLSGSRWAVYDSNGVNRSPENPTVFSKNGVAEYELRYDDWMSHVKHVDIRVDWYNTVAPPGKAVLRLQSGN